MMLFAGCLRAPRETWEKLCFPYTHTRARTRTHTYTRIHTHIYTQTTVGSRRSPEALSWCCWEAPREVWMEHCFSHTHAHTYTHTRTHTHTYIHTHTHTHTLPLVVADGLRHCDDCCGGLLERCQQHIARSHGVRVLNPAIYRISHRFFVRLFLQLNFVHPYIYVCVYTFPRIHMCEETCSPVWCDAFIRDSVHVLNTAVCRIAHSFLESRMQHTATHCNTLQHVDLCFSTHWMRRYESMTSTHGKIATHCNTLTCVVPRREYGYMDESMQLVAIVQHSATPWCVLFYTVSTLIWTNYCNTRQHTTTHRSTL